MKVEPPHKRLLPTWSCLLVSRRTISGMYTSTDEADNVSSFLPQDKVAEFAKMAPVTVLKETMRAAGDPRLTRWHETLKDKGAKLQVIEDVSLAVCSSTATDYVQVQEKDVAKRDELQKQVDRMEPDVRNLREREDQQMRVSITSANLRFKTKSLAARSAQAARRCRGKKGASGQI